MKNVLVDKVWRDILFVEMVVGVTVNGWYWKKIRKPGKIPVKFYASNTAWSICHVSSRIDMAFIMWNSFKSVIMRRMEAKQCPPSERHVCPLSRLPPFPSALFSVMPDLIGHPSHPEISHYFRLQNRFPAAYSFERQPRLQDVCTCHEHGIVSILWKLNL